MHRNAPVAGHARMRIKRPTRHKKTGSSRVVELGSPTHMMTNLSAAVRARLVFGFSALSFTASSLSNAATNNYAPVISGAPVASTVTLGKAYVFKPTASDADRNPLTFTLKNRAYWMAFDAKTGAITGTPWVKGAWSNITMSVSDGKYTKTLPAF